MKKLRAVSPIWHAVIWIVAYIALVGIGDAVSSAIGVPNAATAPIVLLLALGLLLWVRNNGWSDYYGLRPLARSQFRGTLLYIPLLALAFVQLAKGWREDLDPTVVLLVVGLMLGVGIVEELVFRGFLFRAILTKATLTRAVVISGVTFGIGHIVNLARGYTGAEQLLQIGVAIALGVVLALLYAVSGTIVPLIAFHVLFNVIGNLSAPNRDIDVLLLLITVVISIGYSAYLISVLRTRGPHISLRDPVRPVAPQDAVPV